jgi:hypothetical protein
LGTFPFSLDTRERPGILIGHRRIRINPLRHFVSDQEAGRMQRWQYMLAEDREHDLADPDSAARWVAEDDPPHPGASDWQPAVVRAWVEAVHTLRSVALRLKRRRGRESAFTPQQADHVFECYLRMLSPVIRGREQLRIYRGPAGQEPIRAATFRGVKLDYRFDIDDPRMAEGYGLWWLTSEGMWAEAFGSMVSDDFDPVCSGCGSPLGLTPKGRRPRADQCGKCRFAAWKKKQPRAKLRAMWREAKAKERARDEEV